MFIFDFFFVCFIDGRSVVWTVLCKFFLEDLFKPGDSVLDLCDLGVGFISGNLVTFSFFLFSFMNGCSRVDRSFGLFDSKIVSNKLLCDGSSSISYRSSGLLFEIDGRNDLLRALRVGELFMSAFRAGDMFGF